MCSHSGHLVTHVTRIKHVCKCTELHRALSLTQQLTLCPVKQLVNARNGQRFHNLLQRGVQLVAKTVMAATRGLRSTLALLLVLIGLGAYIYFVTWKQSDDSTSSKLEKVFPAVAAQDVQELTVKSEAGEVSSLKKTGDRWELTAPVQAHASESDVSAITGALGQLEVVRVIDENPADLKE